MPRVTAVLVFALASSSPATDTPLSLEAAAALFCGSPDFAGRTERTFKRVSRLLEIPTRRATTRLWMAEAQWEEKGKLVIGAAMVLEESVLKSWMRPNDRPFFSANGWALPFPVQEGRSPVDIVNDLLRARWLAEETNAKADCRTVMSGQATFALDSGGAYGSLDCLIRPQECISDFNGRPLVDPRLAQADFAGYRRRLYLGPKGASFVFTATPLDASDVTKDACIDHTGPMKRRCDGMLEETGQKAFCVDHTGRLCSSADGREPDATGGMCPASCKTLENPLENLRGLDRGRRWLLR